MNKSYRKSEKIEIHKKKLEMKLRRAVNRFFVSWYFTPCFAFICVVFIFSPILCLNIYKKNLSVTFFSLNMWSVFKMKDWIFKWTFLMIFFFLIFIFFHEKRIFFLYQAFSFSFHLNIYIKKYCSILVINLKISHHNHCIYWNGLKHEQ